MSSTLTPTLYDMYLTYLSQHILIISRPIIKIVGTIGLVIFHDIPNIPNVFLMDTWYNLVFIFLFISSYGKRHLTLISKIDQSELLSYNYNVTLTISTVLVYLSVLMGLC